MSTVSTQNIPSNTDFATEVKSDRLSLLWKIAAAVCVLMLLIASMLSGADLDLSIEAWVYAPIVMLIFCFITRWGLLYNRFETAAFAFTSGMVASVTVALAHGSQMDYQMLPFIFVMVIFIAGLLLKPSITFFFAVISAFVSIAVPFLLTESMGFVGGHQIFAIVLMFVSAGVAAQVTGELYAVTEWALLQYQRQRRTNVDLFESRAELHKSLNRAQALSEQLKETNVELEQAHEAAEAAKNFRGQFLANMSHELRTPLNAIIGFSETMLKFPMMYDDTNLPEVYQNDLNQIYTSGRQLLHLINDILDLAKVDAGKLEIYMQLVELGPIIDSVLTTANGLIGSKPIELVANLPDPLPKVWADETRVRQVLLNLYSNACKFTEVGSITLTIKEMDDEVRFTVADTGMGIEDDQLEVIFGEFEQADKSAGRDPRAGAGLGLAISRQLLDLMGGRIWAQSIRNEGSMFHFTLQPYHKNKFETVAHINTKDVPQKDALEAVDSQKLVTIPAIKQIESAEQSSEDETAVPEAPKVDVPTASKERETDEIPVVTLDDADETDEPTQPDSRADVPTAVRAAIQSAQTDRSNQETK